MATATSSITTSWAPPAAISGFSATVVEESSYIQLNWSASTLADVDFSRYEVMRRLAGTTEWEIIRSESSKSITEWRDVYTGQGVAYEYKIVQYKIVPGDVPLVSGDGDIATAALESDVWFVIGGEDAYGLWSFELPVNAESHTRPIQQEVFEPIIGSRKKVVRGNVLGYEGSLSLAYLTTERSTAKTQLKYLAENSGPHLLKSPFGDVWRVEFDAPTYKYTGGGHMQVELGWVEVV